MNDMKPNRDLFYKEMAPFFEAGIFKEIYSSDLISICNVANYSYVIFNYVRIQEGRFG